MIVVFQNPTLEHYTRYKASDLKTTVSALQDLQLNTKGCALNAIREKYKQPKVTTTHHTLCQFKHSLYLFSKMEPCITTVLFLDSTVQVCGNSNFTKSSRISVPEVAELCLLQSRCLLSPTQQPIMSQKSSSLFICSFPKLQQQLYFLCQITSGTTLLVFPVTWKPDAIMS